ncbi:MAG: helix-turn-helix domain-containing protein [Chloroflexi bacterium]|nr:helix-turn-helix domain-containing protein [Chloroflexota bacterium]
MTKTDIDMKSLPATLQFFSVDEVAVILKVSKKMVQQWIQEGHLPAFRVGPQSRLLRIRYQDLEDFVDNNTQLKPPKYRKKDA